MTTKRDHDRKTTSGVILKKLFELGFLLATLLVSAGLLAPVACSTGPEECFAAVSCHKTNCNGPIVRSGCITCESGEVDDRQCHPDVIECFNPTKCHQTDCTGPIVRSGCTVTCTTGEVDDLLCRIDSGSDAPAEASDGDADAAKDAKGD